MHMDVEHVRTISEPDIALVAAIVRGMDPTKPRLDDLQDLHRALKAFSSPSDAAQLLSPDLHDALLQMITAYPQPPASQAELTSWQLQEALFALFGPGAD